MNKTIHQGIKEYLANGNWSFAGPLCEAVGHQLKHKADIVARRFREGESGIGSDGRPCEKYLEKTLVPNPKGKGPKVTNYRLLKKDVEVTVIHLPRIREKSPQLSISF